jgi:hypothetical protein
VKAKVIDEVSVGCPTNYWATKTPEPVKFVASPPTSFEGLTAPAFKPASSFKFGGFTVLPPTHACASMKFAVDKIKLAGNEKVMLTERGNTFGYQDLVVDYRNIPAMAENNVPVIMDCTHSLQQPNQTSGITGGNPSLIETIAKAAIATGADGLFIETHPNPANAKSDGANMLRLELLEPLLEKLVRLRKAVI